jgi:hypothetical protein
VRVGEKVRIVLGKGAVKGCCSWGGGKKMGRALDGKIYGIGCSCALVGRKIL